MRPEFLSTIDGLHVASLIERQPGARITTGWPGIDDALGGGFVNGLHEWFGNASDTDAKPSSFPIEIVTQVARHVRQMCEAKPWAVWVGRRCFPYPATLVNGRSGDRKLLDRSIFVDSETPSNRLWSIEQAIGSSVVGVVIADGSRLNMAATRRIQLRSQTHGAFVFSMRPITELAELSAAQTRWLVRHERSRFAGRAIFVSPRWKVELLRCKGLRSLSKQSVWNLERDRATRTLRLSTEVAHPADHGEATRHTA